jgi:kynurenine formamidase
LKIIDLSYPWGTKEMVVSHYVDGQPVFVPKKWGRNNPWNCLDREDYRVEFRNWMWADGTNCPDVTIWSHAGTHIETAGYHLVNSPAHLKEKGVADYPPERYVGEAAVIDLTPLSKKYGIDLPPPDFTDYACCVPSLYNPAEEAGKGTGRPREPAIIFSIPLGPLKPLAKEDYAQFDSRVRRGDILLVCNRIGGLSLDVNWVIDKGVKVVGMQNAWFHGEKDGINNPHDICLANEVLIIEGIRNIDKLTKDRVFFVGMPWHLLGVGASPIWAIAIEEFDSTVKDLVKC